jgi:hypothetical protein
MDTGTDGERNTLTDAQMGNIGKDGQTNRLEDGQTDKQIIGG